MLKQPSTDWMDAKAQLMKFYGLRPADFWDMSMEEFFELTAQMRKMQCKSDEKAAMRAMTEERLERQVKLLTFEEERVY